MKFPFWDNPNDKIKVLEATAEAQNEYGHRCGSDTIFLTENHINQLLAGKMLAWDDGEYSTFVICQKSHG